MAFHLKHMKIQNLSEPGTGAVNQGTQGTQISNINMANIGNIGPGLNLQTIPGLSGVSLANIGLQPMQVGRNKVVNEYRL